MNKQQLQSRLNDELNALAGEFGNVPDAAFEYIRNPRKMGELHREHETSPISTQEQADMVIEIVRACA